LVFLSEPRQHGNATGSTRLNKLLDERRVRRIAALKLRIGGLGENHRLELRLSGEVSRLSFDSFLVTSQIPSA
jgi:hypothetical protein